MDKQHLEHKVVQGEPYKCYAGRVKYYESDRADVLKIWYDPDGRRHQMQQESELARRIHFKFNFDK